jgi:hypothetical protein
MLEKHKESLLKIPISKQEHRQNYTELSATDPFVRFYGKLEYRLNKAVELAKQRQLEARAKVV